jgi:hypothetical protein
MSKSNDYQQAFELGRKELVQKNPELLARFASARTEQDRNGKTVLLLVFLNRPIQITWPECECVDQASSEPLPVLDKVLLVHYLMGASHAEGPAVTGQWIAFQDLRDGRFYQAAFDQRAKAPLVRGFGSRPRFLIELCTRVYQADPIGLGDYGVVIKVFPLVPMALILWEGDADFPPNGNILFDQNIVKLFSAEDVAWLAGRVIYPLLNL